MTRLLFLQAFLLALAGCPTSDDDTADDDRLSASLAAAAGAAQQVAAVGPRAETRDSRAAPDSVYQRVLETTPAGL